MSLCVTRFHSSLGTGIMLYFTIHDLTVKNTRLSQNTLDKRLWNMIPYFQQYEVFMYLISSYFTLNLNS